MFIFIIMNKVFCLFTCLRAIFISSSLNSLYITTISLLCILYASNIISQYIITIFIYFLVFSRMQVLMYSNLVMFWDIIKSVPFSLVIKQFTHALSTRWFKFPHFHLWSTWNLLCSMVWHESNIFSNDKVAIIFSRKFLSPHIFEMPHSSYTAFPHVFVSICGFRNLFHCRSAPIINCFNYRGFIICFNIW